MRKSVTKAQRVRRNETAGREWNANAYRDQNRCRGAKVERDSLPEGSLYADAKKTTAHFYRSGPKPRSVRLQMRDL
jgi:hypothetical protein